MNTSQAPIELQKAFASNLNFIYQYTAAYILPPAIVTNFFNNILVIVVFLQNSKIRNSLPPTIFLNYLSMAINDISNTFPTQITNFLGTLYFLCLIKESYFYLTLLLCNYC